MALPANIKLPKHIAVIMDGNGRWANARGLPRTVGHHQGVSAVKKLVKSALKLKIEYVTVYAFSSENWNRPKEEVAELMKLLRRFFEDDVKDLMNNGVAVKIFGDISKLDKDLQLKIADIENTTKDNHALHFSIAFGYGGRQDIVNATKKIASDVKAGVLKVDDIDDATFSKCVATYPYPDPDLLIRTSGEERISNFLLWQCAYAEFYFTKTLWPDFNQKALEKAIIAYTKRDRRFGALSNKK